MEYIKKIGKSNTSYTIILPKWWVEKNSDKKNVEMVVTEEGILIKNKSKGVK